MPPPSPSPDGRASGSALLLALAAVFLAAALGLLLQTRCLGAARTARARLAHARCRIAAAEAVRRAAALLAADPDPGCDSAFDAWATPHESPSPSGLAVECRTEDAGRFFSWNNLASSGAMREKSAELAADLMTFCGIYSPDAKIAALADALDGDDDGAWEGDPHADPPYRAQNRLLRAPGELAAIPGWSAVLRAPPDATSRRRFSAGTLAENAAVVPVDDGEEPLRVNVNTASAELLLATAGLARERAVETLLAYRANKPIASLAAIFAARPDWTAQLDGTISTASSWFRIRAEAETDEEGGRAVAVAWVRRDDAGGAAAIRQWIWQDE